MDPSKDESVRPKVKQISQASIDSAQIVLALNKLSDKIEIMDTEFQKIHLKMDEEKKERFNQLEQIVQEINVNFAKYTAEVTEIKDNVDQLQVQTKKIDKQITEIFFKNEKQDRRICILEEEVRKSNIVIRGIVEEKVDNVKQRVLKWLNELGLDKNFITTDLISVYRIGFRRQREIIRNVLVRFASVNDKLQVMAKIRENGDAVLKIEGKQVQVFQDISREERSWRYYLKPITKILRDRGIKYNWRPPQRMKFFYKNRMHIFTIETDAVQYFHELGLLEKEEEQSELRSQLLKMGGIEIYTSTPEEEGGAVGGLGPKPKRKRKPTKDISPSLAEVQKKSRDLTGEGVERMITLDSEHKREDEPECGDEEPVVVQLKPELCQ